MRRRRIGEWGFAMRFALPSKVFFVGMFAWSALAMLALALPT